MNWYLIVGNLGRIECENGFQARQIYGDYKRLSMKNYGRVAGEDVVLFCDDEIVYEHIGSLSANGY